MKRINPPQTVALVGYARVSTLDQSLELQTDALKKAGCVRVFTDTASGGATERPGLEAALNFLREGDTLVVWKLDRLGRSLQHLIQILADLDKRKVAFRSLQEHIDTSRAYGKLFFHLVGSFAEYERAMIKERTKAGLDAARARGRLGGRKPILDEKKLAQAKALLDANTPVSEVCHTLRCSERTLRRRLAP